LGDHDLTSRSLLRRVKANDQEAWHRLVSLYSPLVAHWCRRWGVPAVDRPDLVQEVFTAVAAGLATFRGPDAGVSFRRWLNTIARNKVHDYVRRGHSRGEGGTEALNRLREVPAHAAPSGSSDEVKVAALYRRALEQVHCQFEERTWQAFWQVAIEGRSSAEVASELGLSPNGVRQAKSRVLRRLKEELGEPIA
jgi:RNA polymerase sigma-70 factor, ECF subfamily